MTRVAAGRHRWPATAALLTALVLAAVGAALAGLTTRATAGSGAAAGPVVASTEQPVPESVSEPAPAGPVVKLATAAMTSLDTSTDGWVSLLSIDGRPVLRLHDFRTAEGRGYVLYLVPAADARSPAAGVSLGPLKGARGDQYYPVPVGARLDGPLTALIWSRGFKGPVAHAVLRR